MNRRAFVGAVAGVLFAVAMDVLPAFGYEPEAFEWEEECVLIVEEVDHERRRIVVRHASPSEIEGVC